MEKYKIKASKKQLEDIGISYDIIGLEGIFIKKYPTGYIQLEVEHTYEAGTFTNKFDIPKFLLEKIV